MEENVTVPKAFHLEQNMSKQLNKLLCLACSCYKNLIENYKIQKTQSANHSIQLQDDNSTHVKQNQIRSKSTQTERGVQIQIKASSTTKEFSWKNLYCPFTNQTLNGEISQFVRIPEDTKRRSLNKLGNVPPIRKENISSYPGIIELKYKPNGMHKLTAKSDQIAVNKNNCVQQIYNCNEFISYEENVFQNVITTPYQTEEQKRLADMQPKLRKDFEATDTQLKINRELEIMKMSQRSLQQKRHIPLKGQVAVKLKCIKSKHSCQDSCPKIKHNLYFRHSLSAFKKASLCTNVYDKNTKNQNKISSLQESSSMKHTMISNDNSQYFSQLQLTPPSEKLKKKSFSKESIINMLQDLKCSYNTIKRSTNLKSSPINFPNPRGTFLSAIENPLEKYLGSILVGKDKISTLQIIITLLNNVKCNKDQTKYSVNNLATRNQQNLLAQMQAPYLKPQLAFSETNCWITPINEQLIPSNNKTIFHVRDNKINEELKQESFMKMAYEEEKVSRYGQHQPQLLKSRITDEDSETLLQIINLNNVSTETIILADNMNNNITRYINTNGFENLEVNNTNSLNSMIAENDNEVLLQVIDLKKFPEKIITPTGNADKNRNRYTNSKKYLKTFGVNKKSSLNLEISENDNEVLLQVIDLKKLPEKIITPTGNADKNRNQYTNSKKYLKKFGVNNESSINLEITESNREVLLQVINLRKLPAEVTTQTDNANKNRNQYTNSKNCFEKFRVNKDSFLNPKITENGNEALLQLSNFRMLPKKSTDQVDNAVENVTQNTDSKSLEKPRVNSGSSINLKITENDNEILLQVSNFKMLTKNNVIETYKNGEDRQNIDSEGLEKLKVNSGSSLKLEITESNNEILLQTSNFKMLPKKNITETYKNGENRQHIDSEGLEKLKVNSGSSLKLEITESNNEILLQTSNFKILPKKNITEAYKNYEDRQHTNSEGLEKLKANSGSSLNLQITENDNEILLLINNIKLSPKENITETDNDGENGIKLTNSESLEKLKANSESSLNLKITENDNEILLLISNLKLSSKENITETNKDGENGIQHTNSKNLEKPTVNSGSSLNLQITENDDEILLRISNFKLLPTETTVQTANVSETVVQHSDSESLEKLRINNENSLNMTITKNDNKILLQVSNFKMLPKEESITQTVNVDKNEIPYTNSKRSAKPFKIFISKLKTYFFKTNDEQCIDGSGMKQKANNQNTTCVANESYKENKLFHETHDIDNCYPLITQHDDELLLLQLALDENTKYNNKAVQDTTEYPKENIVERRIYHKFKSRLRPNSSKSSDLKVLGVTNASHPNELHGPKYLSKDPPPVLKELTLATKNRQDNTEAKQQSNQKQELSKYERGDDIISMARSKSSLEEDLTTVGKSEYDKKLQSFKNRENILYEINLFGDNGEHEEPVHYIDPDNTQKSYSIDNTKSTEDILGEKINLLEKNNGLSGNNNKGELKESIGGKISVTVRKEIYINRANRRVQTDSDEDKRKKRINETTKQELKIKSQDNSQDKPKGTVTVKEEINVDNVDTMEETQNGEDKHKERIKENVTVTAEGQLDINRGDSKTNYYKSTNKEYNKSTSVNTEEEVIINNEDNTIETKNGKYRQKEHANKKAVVMSDEKLKIDLEDKLKSDRDKQKQSSKNAAITTQKEIHDKHEDKALKIDTNEDKRKRRIRTLWQNIHTKVKQNKFRDTSSKSYTNNRHKAVDLDFFKKLFVNKRHKDYSNKEVANKELKNSQQEDKISSKKKRTFQPEYDVAEPNPTKENVNEFQQDEQNECKCRKLQNNRMKLTGKPLRQFFSRVYRKVQALLNTTSSTRDVNNIDSETTFNRNIISKMMSECMKDETSHCNTGSCKKSALQKKTLIKDTEEFSIKLGNNEIKKNRMNRTVYQFIGQIILKKYLFFHISPKVSDLEILKRCFNDQSEITQLLKLNSPIIITSVCNDQQLYRFSTDFKCNPKIIQIVANSLLRSYELFSEHILKCQRECQGDSISPLYLFSRMLLILFKHNIT